MYRIAPSILSTDFALLGENVLDVIDAGADWIHFDVMGNYFVPNLSFGRSIARRSSHTVRGDGSAVPLELHLMVQPVQELFIACTYADTDLISSPSVSHSYNHGTPSRELPVH